MRSIRRAISQFVAAEEGVTMIEYGLIIALIALVLLVALASIGTALDTAFAKIASFI